MQWSDQCKAYLKEARWYFSGYKPSLHEYMENAWISISGSVMLFHTYFLIANPIKREDLDQLEELPPIIQHSSLIFRLADDLGTFEVNFLSLIKSNLCYKSSKSYKHYFYLFLGLITVNFFDKINTT